MFPAIVVERRPRPLADVVTVQTRVITPLRLLKVQAIVPPSVGLKTLSPVLPPSSPARTGN